MEKFGLVLSGGGARGLAHIGVIKALEEIGATPSVITGASMGGIIGGLYSMGYSPEEMTRLLGNLDFDRLLDSRAPFASPARESKHFRNIFMQTSLFGLFTRMSIDSGRKIRVMLRELTGEKDFKDLKIPFACVAVDLISAKKVVLKEGKLYKALYATAAIPPYLEPLEYEGMLLTDGGILSNAPCEVARSMGATKVVAVDVNTRQTLRKKENFRHAFDVILRVLDIALDTIYVEELKKSDFLINVSMDFDIFDFESGQEIVLRGYEEASKRLNDLKKFLVTG